jgi:hypothetical protein
VGRPAPDFTLPLLTGGTLNLRTLTGGPVVLNVYHVDYAVARAPGTQLYRIVGIPTTVLIGADGVVVDTYTGALLGPAASVRS